MRRWPDTHHFMDEAARTPAQRSRCECSVRESIGPDREHFDVNGLFSNFVYMSQLDPESHPRPDSQFCRREHITQAQRRHRVLYFYVLSTAATLPKPTS